jgi:hypothetical protein
VIRRMRQAEERLLSVERRMDDHGFPS